MSLPFGFEKPEDSLGFLLWQTTMQWQRQIKRALEPHNFSHPQFVIMATLLWFEAHNYDITQVLIINWTKLDKMTVSNSLRKLANDGYISRVEHETDTRAKSVSVTKKGKAKIRALVPIIEGIDSLFFNRLSGDEQKILLPILAKLSMNTMDE
jgi:DNA-binding MarR family transcriptional regulator